jgi:toxin-antitoxin system PIN domain toxin
VILIDANLLLYAYDESSAHHDASRRWLERMLNGTELVRFAWLTLWAFIRISTNPRLLTRPLSSREAHAIIESWLQQPNAGVLEPGERHLEILRALLVEGQATADLVTDAALAAIAIEHGARLCSTDRDFARFDGLDWHNPTTGQP